MSIYVCYLLLIILIIVAVLLLKSIADDNKLDIGSTIAGGGIFDISGAVGGGENGGDNEAADVAGGAAAKPKVDPDKKIYVVDGLNYIYHHFLTTNKSPVKDLAHENLISNYPNAAYIWKAITKLRADHKKDYIVLVIKNQDGYKLSTYDDKLYKRWAKTYKIGIIVCYDPSVLKGEHYVKGRDDKTVCEIYDNYKKLGANVELISRDGYEDKSYFGNIPSFKKIIYGFVPHLEG
jgi:hypothetical protein